MKFKQLSLKNCLFRETGRRERERGDRKRDRQITENET